MLLHKVGKGVLGELVNIATGYQSGQAQEGGGGAHCDLRMRSMEGKDQDQLDQSVEGLKRQVENLEQEMSKVRRVRQFYRSGKTVACKSGSNFGQLSLLFQLRRSFTFLWRLDPTVGLLPLLSFNNLIYF